MYQHLIFSVEEGVAIVRLNRPESMNALDLELLKELADCLTRCVDDRGVRTVILAGEGRAFSAGGDVKSMSQAPSRPYLLRLLTLNLHTAISAVWRMPKPVIAAVHGAAMGAGFALALSCDLVIAAEKTRFGTAYLSIGLTPDGGTTFFLPKMLGLHRAKYFAFTSEAIDAAAGQQLGFVHRVVKGEDLMAEARKIAGKFASGPTLAIAKAKELLNSSFDQSLETQMESERDAMGCVSMTADLEEGLNAFLNKRSPGFKGE